MVFRSHHTLQHNAKRSATLALYILCNSDLLKSKVFRCALCSIDVLEKLSMKSCIAQTSLKVLAMLYLQIWFLAPLAEPLHRM